MPPRRCRGRRSRCHRGSSGCRTPARRCFEWFALVGRRRSCVGRSVPTAIDTSTRWTLLLSFQTTTPVTTTRARTIRGDDAGHSENRMPVSAVGATGARRRPRAPRRVGWNIPTRHPTDRTAQSLSSAGAPGHPRRRHQPCRSNHRHPSRRSLHYVDPSGVVVATGDYRRRTGRRADPLRRTAGPVRLTGDHAFSSRPARQPHRRGPGRGRRHRRLAVVLHRAGPRGGIEGGPRGIRQGVECQDHDRGVLRHPWGCRGLHQDRRRDGNRPGERQRGVPRPRWADGDRPADRRLDPAR